MLDETCSTDALFRETLEKAVGELGVQVDQRQLDMFCAYKQLLIEANRSVNLGDADEILDLRVRR